MAKPAEPMPRVSIIIPVRGRLALTRRCLESVRRHTPTAHEVIVIDNASGPATRDYLRGRARAGWLRLRRNARNESFAAAINLGMSLARGETLVWLNNDAIVTPEWLSRLSASLERAPEAGAAGPCTNDPLSGSGRGARHAPSPPELPAFAAAWSLRFELQSEEVPRLSGFCLAVRRAAVSAVGPLDEGFRCGEEDEDYCLRLRLAGFKLLLARDAFVYHEGGATRGRWGRERRERVDARNRERFRWKWGGLKGPLRRDALAALRSMS